MSRGHVTGRKREKADHADWFKDIAAENLRRVEAEWSARAAQEQAQQQDQQK